MKAILIIDMPKSCDECMLCDTHEITENGYDYANCYALHQDIKAKFDSDGCFMIKKPKHCPLKPMPQKINELNIEDTITKNNGREAIILEKSFMLANQRGYNKCIDEILGEKDD